MNVEVRAPIAILSAVHRADVASSVDEREREGQPVLLVCLDRTPHAHEPGRADVLHVPALSMGIIAAVVSRLMRDPGHVLGTIRFPVATYLAQILPRRGVVDVQGADPAASRLASVVRKLCDLTPPDLAELPVDWSSMNARRVGVRWVSRRINSIAAEVSIDSNERVVIKRQREHAGGSAAARWTHETRVLADLRQAMGDGPLTVPRILFLDERASMLVMERARGTSLDLLFAAAGDRASMSVLRDGVRGAGAWLAAMQAATRRTEADGRALLTQLIAAAAEDAAKVAATDGVIRRAQATIVRGLEAMAERVSTRELIVAGHHDDYWPGNVFFDGERVTVIDFESFRDGLPLEDAAFFLIRCDLLRRRFRLRFPDLAERFFEGYGQQPDTVALQLFTATKGLRALARGAGDDMPMPQRMLIRRAIRNAVLRQIGA